MDLLFINKNNFYADSSWDNLNPLEVDAWGGCCPNI